MIFAFQFTRAKTWTTISYGYWSSPTVWFGGIVPPLASSDTFNIKHPVAIYNDLFFNSGSFLRIDSSGGICGHNNITIKSGVNFIKYGILEIDSLFIPGGKVYMYAPGSVTLTCYGIVSSGGSILISGPLLMVGPWFNCRTPEFHFTGIEEVNARQKIKLFPNPVSIALTIETELPVYEKAEIEIVNTLGQTILKTRFSNHIDVSNLRQGFYYLRIVSESDEIHTMKFVRE